MSNPDDAYLPLLHDIAEIVVPYWVKGDKLQYLYLDDIGYGDFWEFRDPSIPNFRAWKDLCQTLRTYQRRNRA